MFHNYLVKVIFKTETTAYFIGTRESYRVQYEWSSKNDFIPYIVLADIFSQGLLPRLIGVFSHGNFNSTGNPTSITCLRTVA